MTFMHHQRKVEPVDSYSIGELKYSSHEESIPIYDLQ